MALNETLQFHDASADVKRAFSGGPPVRRHLQTGHRLYKFTGRDLFDGQEVTAWWSSVEPISADDTGLERLLERSGRLGADASQFARARNAVTKQWNSMSGLLVAELISPVVGFSGRVAHQRYDTQEAFSNVFFIGGAVQLWIPNLTAACIRKVHYGSHR